ncbi:MAG: SET domain-containing protein-lysine N-methyltransferase, partial [Candidatus Diapherotrites archaeon]|nr:SET domain-containing protein-lysine N-methyltransferase [Candidatus Diapherotrites archaeon]
ISKNKWIEPFKKNSGYFLNHSCNPNCGLKGLNKITAMKKIGIGEEISIEYSTIVDLKSWDMECMCASKNCRKIIKSYKFLPENLKKKYKNWKAEFLEFSIEKTC